MSRQDGERGELYTGFVSKLAPALGSVLLHAGVLALAFTSAPLSPAAPPLGGGRGDGFEVRIRARAEVAPAVAQSPIPNAAPEPTYDERNPDPALTAAIVPAIDPPEAVSIVHEGTGTTAPVLAAALDIVYPKSCRRNRHEGVSVVRATIDLDGRALAVELVESAGCDDLDRAAEEAIRRARFAPARDGVRPVRATIVQSVRFELRKT